MEIEKRELRFTVEGSFVTRIAREWFYDDNKPWDKIEELLFSCMCGTDATKEELRLFALDVVFGRRKYIGNSGDGSYAMVRDGDDLLPVRRYNKLFDKAKTLEEECSAWEDKYYELTGWLADNGYGHLIKRMERENGHIVENDAPNLSSMLDSFMEQAKIEQSFDDNYGWLDPQGTFYPGEWGTHQVWAEKKATELGYLNPDNDDDAIFPECGSDRLVDRGWVLLHSPSQGVPVVSGDDTRRLTKAQREFLFGYYTDRGLDKEAKQYLEDE